MLPASMPPIANQGDVGAAPAAAWRISSSPAAGRPCLVGVSQTGPALIWSGRSPLGCASAASNCAGEWVESPTSAAGPGGRARLGDRHVVLADVDAVGAAGLDQVGPVVEEEERPVTSAARAKRLATRDQLLGAARRLLAQLDHVDAAAQRRVEQRPRVGAVRAGLADEIEARGGEPAPAGLEELGGSRLRAGFVRRVVGHRGGVSLKENGSPTAMG